MMFSTNVFMTRDHEEGFVMPEPPVFVRAAPPDPAQDPRVKEDQEN